MHKLHGVMRTTYIVDRVGMKQLWTLCASVIVPRKVSDDELRHAANEVFRINDELRVRFVEDPETHEVYQEIKPYAEQSLETLTFGSKAELDAWGDLYATIPLELDTRSLGKKGIPTKYWLSLLGFKVKLGDVIKGIKDSRALAKTKKQLGLKSEPCCCEIKLVQLPDASGVVVKVHHIVSDAWAISLMANQFLQVLKGETPVAYSYEEHLESEEAYRQSKAYKRDIAFFEKQLEQCEPWPAATSQAAKRKTVTLDKDLSADIWDYAATHNLTPYALFLASMSVYLRCKKGLNKFFIASACANRTGVREKNMVGLFYTTPSLFLEPDANASFADTVAYVNAANFTCMRHQKASYDVSNPYPYGYNLSYQNAVVDADPTAVCTQYYCNMFSICMLTAEDRSQDGHFKLHLDHNLELFPSEEMDELLAFVVATLREGIADDSRPINQLGA